MKYEPVPIETNTEARTNYLAGRCDVYTTDRSGLAATRAATDNPDDHVVLPEIISKEPLGPLVRHGDDQWADIVRWSLNAMVAAEEMGVTGRGPGGVAGWESRAACTSISPRRGRRSRVTRCGFRCATRSETKAAVRTLSERRSVGPRT